MLSSYDFLPDSRASQTLQKPATGNRKRDQIKVDELRSIAVRRKDELYQKGGRDDILLLGHTKIVLSFWSRERIVVEAR